MTDTLSRILKLLLIAVLALGSAGVAADSPPVPKPPSIGATAYILQDFNSGQILAESDADKPIEPASITKLMTAYVVFRELESGNITLQDAVTISEKAWRTPGSRMFVEVGKQVSVEDLLKGMIIQSGNDATVALAEYVAGSEDTFAAVMNRDAQELGLSSTHFTNSTGLPDPELHTTARDIASLTARLIREFPEYYKWYSQRNFTFNEITQYNRNKLLWRDESVDGVKTGHTDSAGYCLVTSAAREGMRLISVVLGTKSENARADASQALLNYGFRFFETHKLYNAGTALTTTRVWKGSVEDLPLGLADTLYATVPRGQYGQLDASMTVENRIMAPVTRGQQVGSVHIRLGDSLLSEKPLVALQDVPEGSIWRRIVDEALIYFD
jgi:D-alanyl-D-alanine carboxypeptidase (penicillin-binding protein 5/6)